MLCWSLQASLTYAEAQMKIDDRNMNDDITKNLRGLNKLAKILKAGRIEKGWASVHKYHSTIKTNAHYSWILQHV